MKRLGGILLGVWLVLYGLRAIIGLDFDYDHMVMGVLALVAGILVIINR